MPHLVRHRSGSFGGHPRCSAAQNGAGGENRTHDLPLTKGLRYHYATPASCGISGAKRRAGALLIAESVGQRKGRNPVKSAGRKGEKDARVARLAAALRENLTRRKAQARAKAEGPEPPARVAGTAPQAGLENAPEQAPAKSVTR